MRKIFTIKETIAILITRKVEDEVHGFVSYLKEENDLIVGFDSSEYFDNKESKAKIDSILLKVQKYADKNNIRLMTY